MNRLHPDILHSLPPDVRIPRYDRARLRPGILHLGPGAFHRAHQAVFTEDAMEKSTPDWGIVGVSLRSPEVSRQITPQDGLYSVWSEDGSGRELRVIGAVQGVLVAREDLPAVVAALADASIRIVTLTITEKGYALAADGQSLDVADEQVAADLARPDEPVTAVGVLALGLKARLEAGGASLTVISCDNLSENSKRLGNLLRDYLTATFPAVLPWLDDAVTFPCSMVDRIVPAMTDARKQRQGRALGCSDEGAVSTEPFSQWVIEDNFAAGRPDWHTVGVQLVDEILPYENIKLRLLNASHSAIAYCGLLAGKDTVDAVMADGSLRRYVERLMAEDLVPALDVPAGFDLPAYREQLLARFSNPCLGHRCAQIAMDGSEKIPQRWLPALQAVAAPCLRRALSAWCYLVLFTELPLEDPRSESLYALRRSDAPLADRLSGVLACARVGSETLAGFSCLLQEIERHIATLDTQGAGAVFAVSGSA
jgi:fructuronate reductase